LKFFLLGSLVSVKKKNDRRKTTKKKGKVFESFRCVTAWPRPWMKRKGISPYCFASSSCRGLVGKAGTACRKSWAGARESQGMTGYLGKD